MFSTLRLFWILMINLLSFSSFSQTLIYEKDEAIFIYSLEDNVKKKITKNQKLLLKDFKIENNNLLVYSNQDTFIINLDSNWNLSPLSLTKIKSEGAVNIVEITDSITIRELKWNYILCDGNNEVWSVRGNKHGNMPKCDDMWLNGNANMLFKSSITNNKEYIAYVSFKKGIVGRHTLFIARIADGKTISIRGMNPHFSNVNNYILYQSDLDGVYNIFDIENNLTININANKAIWVSN